MTKISPLSGTFLLTCLLSAPARAQPADSARAQQAPQAQPSSGIEVSSEAYQRLSRKEKAELLWERISQDPYETLPTKGAVTGALRAVWGRFSLRQTFDEQGDTRPARNKIFHRQGTAVRVRYETVGTGIVGRLQAEEERSNPYTGIFAEGSVGIARLSLGLGDTKLWAPGIGLKLFVDGKPSVNFHAIPRDGAQKSKDFMAATLDTKIDPTPLDWFLRFSSKADPTHRKTDHVAAVTPAGEVVAEPKSPFRLEFRPSQEIRYSSPPAWGSEDFRDSLAKIQVGSVLYEVWAVPAEGQGQPLLIGKLRTESAFVASAFQDTRLHFNHAR